MRELHCFNILMVSIDYLAVFSPGIHRITFPEVSEALSTSARPKFRLETSSLISQLVQHQYKALL